MKYAVPFDEENCFKTISDFKECIVRGGEPVLPGRDCNMAYAFTEISTASRLQMGHRRKFVIHPMMSWTIAWENTVYGMLLPE